MTMTEETAVLPFPKGRWQSLFLAALWLGFIAYGIWLSPPSAPNTVEVIGQLSTGQWAELNPGVVVLFNLMGLWPIIYASLALSDGREQAIPAWPFVVGAFGFGAFALMPYLALRKPTYALPHRPKTGLIKAMNHPLVGVGVSIAALLLVVYGISQGDIVETWQDFSQQFATSRFIHVMTLDFCMLTLLTPSLLWDDIARRRCAAAWRAVSLLPLLGPALYLALRPAVKP